MTLPSGPLVKICSLREPEDGRVAAAAGADLVGLIFAPARRMVSVGTAARIIQAVRQEGGRAPRVVGVFVNEAEDRVKALVETLDLDLVQFSGDESPAEVGAAGRPVIKALRLPAGTTLDAARAEADRFMATPVAPLALLIDSHVAGAHGGTGTVGDWELAARLAEEYPVILAGGLNPGNVARAIEAVRPLGVDVSSGVETGGVKDHDKIRDFVGEARAAYSRYRMPTPSSERARITG